MTEQVLLYVLLGLVLLLLLRKALLARFIRHYDASEHQERLRSNRNVILLDVRSSREWSHEHIKGAVHIPLHELERRIEELEKFKNREQKPFGGYQTEAVRVHDGESKLMFERRSGSSKGN